MLSLALFKNIYFNGKETVNVAPPPAVSFTCITPFNIPAGLGSSPTSIFTGLRPVKISECGHTRIACRFVQAPKMARKNGGTRFSYASSVSLAAFIAWIVASTIFSSFSSRALSMASIRFLHSLPLFLDG